MIDRFQALASKLFSPSLPAIVEPLVTLRYVSQKYQHTASRQWRTTQRLSAFTIRLRTFWFFPFTNCVDSSKKKSTKHTLVTADLANMQCKHPGVQWTAVKALKSRRKLLIFCGMQLQTSTNHYLCTYSESFTCLSRAFVCELGYSVCMP